MKVMVKKYQFGSIINTAFNVPTQQQIQQFGQKLSQIDSLKPKLVSKTPALKNFANNAIQSFKENPNFYGTVASLGSAVLGNRPEYNGDKGYITQTGDVVYDALGNAISTIPGWGQAVWAGMQGAKLLGKVAGKLGAGTDGMTGFDSVMGISGLNITPLALINGAFGKRTNKLNNQNYFDAWNLNQTADAYAQDERERAEAANKSGKYGLFSGGARNSANTLINEENQDALTRLAIAKDMNLQKIRSQYMTSINNQNYQNLINGILNPIAFGQKGMKMNKRRLKRISKMANTKLQEQNKFIPNSSPKLNDQQTGEKSVGIDEQGNPLFVKGDGSIGAVTNPGEGNLFQLIENSDANFAKRLKDPNRKAIMLPNGEWGNFKLAWSEDETGTIVYPEIQEINGELIDLSNNPDAAWKSAIENNDYIYFPSNDAADWFIKNYRNYYKGFKERPKQFNDKGVINYEKQGGQLNLIPEGALHARKNNMEGAGKDFTAKGIPVVDNQGNQQAEIEKEELILNKDNTNYIEERYKKFYSDDTSEEDKNKLAIEVGKKFVKELFTNTDDRTGLIEKVENDTK